MIIQKKLLILVDGSERSIQTVNYVKDFMPVDDNTQIVLFHVFSGISEEYLELSENPKCHSDVRILRERLIEQQRKNRESIERAKNILVSRGFSERLIEIKVHSLEQGVARDIINEAKNGYSAVVMRRRGMGALKSIILGSVAVKLLQALTFIPIIIVGQVPPVKKILFAVDTSLDSFKAVEFTASLLGGQGYEACLFHAILSAATIDSELSGMNDLAMSNPCIEAFKSKAALTFKAVRNMLVKSGFESEKISEKIITGVSSRSGAIVEEAEASGCGTIVVGRRGLSKVEAFFMGRVGHKVVYSGKKFTVWVV